MEGIETRQPICFCIYGKARWSSQLSLVTETCYQIRNMLPWPADLLLPLIGSWRPVSVHPSKLCKYCLAKNNKNKRMLQYNWLENWVLQVLMNKQSSNSSAWNIQLFPCLSHSCGMFLEGQYFPWQMPIQSGDVYKNLSCSFIKGFLNQLLLDV